MSKIHVPDALLMLEKAVDDLTGINGAGKKISNESAPDGALGRFAALAKAISGASSAGGIRPGTAIPAWAAPSTPATVPAAPPPKVKTKLEHFRELQASGRIKESHDFYFTHRAALLAEEVAANARVKREDIVGR